MYLFYVIDKSAKVVNSLIAYMTEWAMDELENGIEFHPPGAVGVAESSQQIIQQKKETGKPIIYLGNPKKICMS